MFSFYETVSSDGELQAPERDFDKDITPLIFPRVCQKETLQDIIIHI